MPFSESSHSCRQCGKQVLSRREHPNHWAWGTLSVALTIGAVFSSMAMIWRGVFVSFFAADDDLTPFAAAPLMVPAAALLAWMVLSWPSPWRCTACGSHVGDPESNRIVPSLFAGVFVVVVFLDATFVARAFFANQMRIAKIQEAQRAAAAQIEAAELAERDARAARTERLRLVAAEQEAAMQEHYRLAAERETRQAKQAAAAREQAERERAAKLVADQARRDKEAIQRAEDFKRETAMQAERDKIADAKRMKEEEAARAERERSDQAAKAAAEVVAAAKEKVREGKARAKLGLIKDSLDSADPDIARRRLKQVVDDYPGTKAAEEAADLLRRRR